MVDVTRDNFQDLYPILKEKIETCKFISFDEEMSGINSNDPLHRYRKDDVPAIRYTKMIHVATKYSIIQFGLCFFHENETGGGLVASPYNFYVFPDLASDIVVNASSIEFLRKNKMDFGLWFSKGIPFVDSRGEEWLKKKFSIIDTPTATTPTTAAAAPPDPTKRITLTRQSDLDFMETNFQLFQQFLENSSNEIFEFQECNSYLRRYIYQQVELLYSNDVIIKKSETGNSLCAYKISKDSKIQHDLEQKLKRENDFKLAMGFRRLFKDLVASKKPLVGHNNLFDLLFMSRWFDASLPENFDDYRTRLHSQFPSIFDTKFIESSGLITDPSLDTILDSCYQKYVTKSTVPISIHSDCSSFNPEAANFHNAGFDAYCTGYIFANQMYQANGSFQFPSSSSSSSSSSSGDTSSAVQSPSLFELTQNKLFGMLSLFNVNMDPNSSSALSKYVGSTILRITNFVKEVTTETFLSVEYPLGDETRYAENLELVWIDDYSLFLIFPSCSENDERVLNYKKLAPSSWEFLSFDDFIASSSGKQSMEEVVDDQEDTFNRADSPVGRPSILSRAVSAILSPFRWAANVEQVNHE